MPSNIPPGGLITSGIGGCVVTGDLGVDLSTGDFTETNFNVNDDGNYLDLGRWTIDPLYIVAECPHSGTAGAITRRLVAYDFRFVLEIPYDYNNPPEQIFAGAGSIAVRFNLADPNQDPLLQNQDPAPEQQFYIAPSAFMERAPIVLNAQGDIVRQQIIGSGNGLLFHLPFDKDDYTDYVNFLTDRGWWS
jgi:hypothetical protein